MKKKNGYNLTQIGNADQTSLTFDLSADTTVNPKVAPTVSIKKTGNEKNRFTVMLACTADGGKLPAHRILCLSGRQCRNFEKAIELLYS